MTEHFTFSKSRILIIDDNPAIHADFRKVLCCDADLDRAMYKAMVSLFNDASPAIAATSFEIDSAMQGEEGLEMMQRALNEGRPYAMAFIDVRMPPGMDGIETTQKIWSIYPDLQVVICTAYSDYSWVEMIGKIGQSDRLLVLKKPFDNIEALQLAHALTEKWHLLQQTRALMEALEKIAEERTSEIVKAHERSRLVEANYADLVSLASTEGGEH